MWRDGIINLLFIESEWEIVLIVVRNWSLRSIGTDIPHNLISSHMTIAIKNSRTLYALYNPLPCNWIILSSSYKGIQVLWFVSKSFKAMIIRTHNYLSSLTCRWFMNITHLRPRKNTHRKFNYNRMLQPKRKRMKCFSFERINFN
jgi:hypothetical protein